MLRWLVFIGLALFAAMLQVTVLSVASGHGVYVDLLLLVAVYASWHAPRNGPVAAWLCGWAKDLFSQDALGLNALAFLCVGLILARAGKALSRKSIHTIIVVAMLASAGTNTFLGVRTLLVSHGAISDYVGRGVAATLATSLAAPILFWVANRLKLPARFSIVDKRYV